VTAAQLKNVEGKNDSDQHLGEVTPYWEVPNYDGYRQVVYILDHNSRLAADGCIHIFIRMVGIERVVDGVVIGRRKT
jgi:hypothetical protein